jgi:hypothetical protein
MGTGRGGPLLRLSTTAAKLPHLVGSVSSIKRPVLLVRLNVIHSPGTNADWGMEGELNLTNPVGSGEWGGQEKGERVVGGGGWGGQEKG